MVLVTISGIVVALLLALFVAAVVGSHRFRKRYEKEKADLVSRARPGAPTAPAMAAVADLPFAVQRYVLRIRDGHARSIRCQTLRDRPADAPGTAGNERHLID